jgi:hypothetical protein
MFLSFKDDIGNEQAIVALALSPKISDAMAYMKSAGYQITEIQLENIKRNKAAEVEKVRKQYAPQLEAKLTGDMLDEARYATEVINLAIQRTEERLKANLVIDPARVARDLSQIRSQGIEKKLALEGRPTSITENRTPDEIVRALVGMGVAKEITVESTAVEEE